MYIASLDGYVHAIDIRLGDVMWTHKSSSGAITSALSTLRQEEPKVGDIHEDLGTEDMIYYSDNFGFLSALHTLAKEYTGESANSNSLRISFAPSPFPTVSTSSIAPVSSDIDHSAHSVMPSSSLPKSSMPSYHIVRETQSPTTTSVVYSALSQFTNQHSSPLSTPVLLIIIIASAVVVYLLVRYVLNFTKARAVKHSKLFVSDKDDLFHDAVSGKVSLGEVVKPSSKGITNRNKTFMSMLTKQKNTNKVFVEPLLSSDEVDLTAEGNEDDRKYNDVLRQKTLSNRISNTSDTC